MNGGRTLRPQIPHLGIKVIFEIERHLEMNRWRCAARRSGAYGRIWCGNGNAVWTGRPINATRNVSISKRLRSNPYYRVFGIPNLILRLPVTLPEAMSLSTAAGLSTGLTSDMGRLGQHPDRAHLPSASITVPEG